MHGDAVLTANLTTRVGPRKSRVVPRSVDHKGSARAKTMGNLTGYAAAMQCVALRLGV